MGTDVSVVRLSVDLTSIAASALGVITNILRTQLSRCFEYLIILPQNSVFNTSVGLGLLPKGVGTYTMSTLTPFLIKPHPHKMQNLNK